MALTLEEYTRLDATALAALVRKGEVSAGEVLDVALTLHERLHPRLNAVITLMEEPARRQIERIDLTAPFAGVPFLLKDLLCAYAGVPMSSGSRAMRDWRPHYHSYITERFMDAGLVVFGKTNTPECGLLATTEPDAFGATRNPWNLDLSAGGSSGGSAAAVAARLVPAASAGDGGGSIRIPAALCGLFGLKPSRGRVSNGPACGESWNGAVSQHVLTRSVRDSAGMLDCIAGVQPGDFYTAPTTGHSFLSATQRDPGRLRVALASRRPWGLPVDADTQSALSKTAGMLGELGHHIEECEPPIDPDALLSDFLMIYYGAVAADIATWEALLGGQDISGLIEPPTQLFRRIGERIPVAEVERARQRWHHYAMVMARFMEHHDVVVMPVTAMSHWKLGDMKISSWEAGLLRFADRAGLAHLLRENVVRMKSREMLARVPFTQLANLTGQPAMSVPVHVSAEGVPVGVQIIGRYGQEDLLFSLAAQLERGWPWADRMPAATPA